MSPPSLSMRLAQLRARAHREAAVARVLEALPSFPPGDAAAGLYADARRVPGLEIDGRLVVSVVRLYSWNGERAALVGQVQASAAEGDDVVRTYVHRPARGETEELTDPDAWFVAVLEEHYRMTGAPVELGSGVER